MGLDKLGGVIETYILNRIDEAKKGSDSLDLSYCNLVSIPEPLFQLFNLQKLKLEHNYLTFLPEEINQLSNLIEVDLEMNQLTTIPNGIGGLVNLEKLNLKCNQLQTLPSEIGKLTNLIELDLRGNQLTTLPPEITQLTNLKHIYLQGNPLQIPPLDIANKGMDAIIEYFNLVNFGNNSAEILNEKPGFKWNDEGNLRFELHYKRMPLVLLTLFIDKQREEKRIEDDLYWKDGVVLHYENNKALIEVDSIRLIIKISIDGTTRKELLTLIRKDLQSIYESLSITEVKEIVPCICKKCSAEPYLYSHDKLRAFLVNGQYKVVCLKSNEDILIEDLLREIENLFILEESDLFEGWSPDNTGGIRIFVNKDEVIVIHGQNHTSTKYSYDHLNQIIYEIIKKKVHSETELRNMQNNLNIIKNPRADKVLRQNAIDLFKVFIKYLSDTEEHVLAGFLYESLKNMPLLVKNMGPRSS